MIKSFRDLFIWRSSVELASSIAALVQTFPRDKRWVYGDQMLRSSVSVASNIAEGWGRASSREFHRFLAIARGSLCELETQLEIATMNGLVNETQRTTIDRLIAQISVGITRLMRRL